MKSIKKQKWAACLAGAAALALLTACGSRTASSAADYIGIDAAKEAALAAAGADAGQVQFENAGLDSQNGTFFYQVIFTENGTTYEYDIDALTGVVIEETIRQGSWSDAGSRRNLRRNAGKDRCRGNLRRGNRPDFQHRNLCRRISCRGNHQGFRRGHRF